MVATWTRYPVSADPPVLVGATHVRATVVLAEVPATVCAAVGTVVGVTDDDADDDADVPAEFVAVTVKV